MNCLGGKNNTGVNTVPYFESDLLPQSQQLNIGSNNLKWNNLFVQRLAIPTASSNPTNPIAGQIYFNTGDSKIYVYNGAAWVKTATLA